MCRYFSEGREVIPYLYLVTHLDFLVHANDTLDLIRLSSPGPWDRAYSHTPVEVCPGNSRSNGSTPGRGPGVSSVDLPPGALYPGSLFIAIRNPSSGRHNRPLRDQAEHYPDAPHLPWGWQRESIQSPGWVQGDVLDREDGKVFWWCPTIKTLSFLFKRLS